MNKIFIPISTDGETPVYVPVIKIEYGGDRDYLLKKSDRRKVRAVYEYLDGRGLEVFLGGEAVQSRFQDSRFLAEPYQHIDMIAVGSESQAAAVFKELTESDPRKMPFNYSNITFRVSQKSERQRFNPKEVEEFWINARKFNATSHAINLSLITDNLFRNYQRK